MVDLIYDYLQNRVGNALVQKDYSPRIMEILNKIALEFKKRQLVARRVTFMQ